MDRAFHLPPGKAAATLRLGIIGTVNFEYIAFRILHDIVAFDEISMLQTNFIAREQAEIFAWRILHEIFTFNIDFAGERNLTMPHFRILTVILCFQQLALSFRIVRDDDFERIENRHRSRRLELQILADEMIEHLQVNFAIGFGNPRFVH
ncbi:hypothetical protein D3C77_588680 [compost metagenome]